MTPLAHSHEMAWTGSGMRAEPHQRTSVLAKFGRESLTFSATQNFLSLWDLGRPSDLSAKFFANTGRSGLKSL